MIEKLSTSRRRFLGWGAVLGASLTSCSESGEMTDEGPSALGGPIRKYGERSPHEQAVRGTRMLRNPEVGSSRTPLEDTYGIITPSSLHFERHHSGVPNIDPAEHRVLVHGMVDKPLVFTMDELKSLPSVSKVYFVECSGNSGGEWSENGGPTVSTAFGLASCSEWTGVPLRALLEMVGVQSDASWILAEGDDPCHMQRSLPLAKALDDCLLAYGQNGEAIRPEQGYPLRLIAPGYEGNTCVKWLRRIKVSDGPFHVKDETSKYSELMPDGKAWQFTLEMDAKSVITSPSGGQSIAGPGAREISGLAWSGRGLIERVEISADGGETWRDAQLQEPRHPMAFTRFRLPWEWDGAPATLQSRATDETGYVQPTRERLIEERGRNSSYHNNRIKVWHIAADGGVTNG